MAVTPAPRRRENRTRYVVLGMLTSCPMNGYALRKAIAGSVGHFWQESFGQLYPTLRTLAGEGLIREERAQPPPPAGRPDGEQAARSGRAGATYAITPAGREALCAWLALPPALDPMRSEVLLKVFFGAFVGREVLLGNLAGLAGVARAQLEALEAIARQLDALPESSRGGPYPRLTLDFGMRFMRLALEWLADVEHASARAHAPVPASSPRSSRRTAGRGARSSR